MVLAQNILFPKKPHFFEAISSLYDAVTLCKKLGTYHASISLKFKNPRAGPLLGPFAPLTPK